MFWAAIQYWRTANLPAHCAPFDPAVGRPTPHDYGHQSHIWNTRLIAAQSARRVHARHWQSSSRAGRQRRGATQQSISPEESGQNL